MELISREAAIKSLCAYHKGKKTIGQCIDDVPTIQAVPIEVLQEIRQEIEKRRKNSGGEPNRELAFDVCLKIIDTHINNRQFERIWQNTVEEMRQRKICEDILEEAEEYDSETMSGSLLTDDDLRLLINDAIKEKKAEQDKVTKPLDDELQEIRQEIEKIPTTIKGIGYFNERDVLAYQIDVLKIIDTHISAITRKSISDRDCEHCKHRHPIGCDVWECTFESRDEDKDEEDNE